MGTTGMQRDLTIFTDVKIFTRPVQHMCNYIYEPGYLIRDFGSALQAEKIRVIGETILLVIGNYQLDTPEPGNMYFV